MNILLFVTSLVMVMAMLTYARLETYRSFSLLQAEFKNYMDQTERRYINLSAEEWYDYSMGSKSNSKPQGQGTVKNNEKTSSRLSLALFIDKAKKEKALKEYPKFHLMAKKLIHILFKDQPFYQEMEQKRPDFVDSLLNALMAANDLPKKQKPKLIQDLANPNLGDEELNTVFYKMMQDTLARREKKPVNSNKAEPPPSLIEEDKGENDDKELENQDRFEYKSSKGVFSLLDYSRSRRPQKSESIWLQKNCCRPFLTILPSSIRSSRRAMIYIVKSKRKRLIISKRQNCLKISFPL